MQHKGKKSQTQYSSLLNASGFTLIEVMLALVVLVIGILGVFSMQIATVQGNAAAMSLSKAVMEAAAVADKVESLAYDNNALDASTGASLTTLFGSGDEPAFETTITYSVSEQTNLQSYFTLTNDKFSDSSCKVVTINSARRVNGQNKTLTNTYFKFDALDN